MSTRAVGERQSLGCVEEVLHGLCERSVRSLHIRYSSRGGIPGLANHMLHMLVALKGIGASSERLYEYFDEGAKDTGYGTLEPAIPPEIEINESNWKDFVGKNKYYADYINFFERELQVHGIQPTISKYFPILMDGLASDAFHVTIQLGFGLEEGGLASIASGLAYIPYAYASGGQLPFEKLSDRTKYNNCTSLVSILQRVHEAQLSEDIRQIRATTMFPKVLSEVVNKHVDFVADCSLSWQIGDGSSAELTEEDVKKAEEELFSAVFFVFHQTGCTDFFLLHGITGMYGLHQILPYLSNPTERAHALRYMLHGFLLTYVVQGSPEIEEHLRNKIEPNTTWKEVLERAVSSNDEHIPKIVYVCYTRDKKSTNLQHIDHNTNSLYLDVAKQVLDKILTPTSYSFLPPAWRT